MWWWRRVPSACALSSACARESRLGPPCGFGGQCLDRPGNQATWMSLVGEPISDFRPAHLKKHYRRNTVAKDHAGYRPHPPCCTTDSKPGVDDVERRVIFAAHFDKRIALPTIRSCRMRPDLRPSCTFCCRNTDVSSAPLLGNVRASTSPSCPLNGGTGCRHCLLAHPLPTCGAWQTKLSFRGTKEPLSAAMTSRGRQQPPDLPGRSEPVV